MRARFAVFTYQAIARFLCVLPPRFVLAAASRLARWYSSRCEEETEIATTQLALAAHYPGIESSPLAKLGDNELARKEVVQACFAHVGESLAELLLIDRIAHRSPPNSRSRVDVRPLVEEGEGVQEFVQVAKKGLGCLALAGHIGNFELLAAMYINHGIPLSVLGRTPNYPVLAELLSHIRRHYGADLVWRNQPGAAKALLRGIKNGYMIGVLIDQDTNLENGFADFFGLPAASPIEIVQLAVRLNLPVFSTFIVRTAPFSHRAVARHLAYDRGDPAAPVKILKAYNEHLEHLVAAYPEQWLWWHRRWRRRPEVDYKKNPELLPSTSRYLDWLRREITTRAARSDSSASQAVS